MSDVTPEVTETSPTKPVREPIPVVGFWVRLISDIIDVILLGVFGFLLSIPLRTFFYTLGQSGWWIGIIIAFLYAGLLHSSIGQGQSLGKMILGIQVVKMDGRFLSLPESFLRYTVLAFIAYNDGIGAGLTNTFPSLQNPYFGIAYFLLVLLCLFGVILIVPFHPLKQGLHDLLVGSIVVPKGGFSREKIDARNSAKLAKRAYLIATVGSLVVSALVLISTQSNLSSLSDSSPILPKMESLSASIGRDTLLTNVQMELPLNGPRKGEVLVTGFLPKSVFDDEARRTSQAKLAAWIIFHENPEQTRYMTVQVIVRTGFNIGIFTLGEKAPPYSFGHEITESERPM